MWFSDVPQSVFYSLWLPLLDRVVLMLVTDCTATMKWLRPEFNFMLHKCLDWHEFYYHQNY